MLDLSLEDNRKALIRISQFVLEEEIDKTRDDLQEKIVETAMFWGMQNDEYASIDRITELVEKEIRLIKFPGLVLDSILSRLSSKGSIVQDEKGSYNLSVLRRAELTKLVDEKKRRIDRINGQFLLLLEREYGRKLTDDQMKLGLEKLYSLLASLALEKSDLIARIVTKKNLENLPMEISIHKLYGILGEVEEIDLRNAEFRAIKLIFREGSDDFCSFLFYLTQNLVCIQILNLDPECQALEKKAFSGKTLFLDTNVLVGLICPTHWQHKPSSYIVTLSNSLGMKSSVTKATCDEFLFLLEEANRIFKEWAAPMKFLGDADNEFLTSFWSEKQSDQSLSWNTYYQRTKDIGRILNEQGIQLYVESTDKIRRNQHFKTIMTQVNTCYQSIKVKNKSAEVCEHDALLMLLVRELRGQSMAILGPDYWFITGDESLFCVDNRINSISDFKDKTPSSILVDIWLGMISPFLPLSIREKDAYEAFTLLVKHQFGLLPFQIDTEKLVRIQGSWTKYEWLEAEDIIKIQNQEWTKQYLKRLEQVKKQGDNAKAEELGRIFSKKLEEELGKIKDDKIKQLAEEKKTLLDRQALLSTTIEEKMKEISSKQTLIELQKEDIDQKQKAIQSKEKELQKETHFKRQIRVISVIAGLFLIASPLVMLVTKALPLTTESVAYGTASLIVGAILLYFGIAPERADVSVGAKLGVPQSKDKGATTDLKLETLRKEESMPPKKKYDVFICHASEDKETFVRILAEALSKEDLEVWYDEFTLSLGDSLRRKIDHGLSNSRYGVVVLSDNFFRKDWPQKELDGLVAKEGDFDKVILPIWHGVTKKQVESFSPMLADRLAVSSDKGMAYVIKEILRAIKNE